MDLEIRSNESHVIANEDGITGYAVVWYNPHEPGTQFKHPKESVVERVDRRACDKALESGQEIFALMEHNWSVILGRRSSGTVILSTDGRGLKYFIPYDRNDPDHQRAIAKVNRRDIRGSSFGFDKITSKSTWSRENGLAVRTLTELDIREVSITPLPCYSATEQRSLLKSLEEWERIEATNKRFREMHR